MSDSTLPVFAPGDYLDLAQTEHAALFEGVGHAWEVLPKIAPYLKAHLRPANHGRMLGQPYIGEQVYIGEGTVIEPGACIKGPAWIGPRCEIRHGAYIRENVIVGAGCVVGNATELKNSLLFDGCQAPHYNYVGDSILGAKAHLGAGVIVSNLKLNGEVITLHVGRPLSQFRPAEIRRAARRRRRGGLQRGAESGLDHRAAFADLPGRLLARHPARKLDRPGRRQGHPPPVAAVTGATGRGRLSPCPPCRWPS